MKATARITALWICTLILALTYFIPDLVDAAPTYTTVASTVVIEGYAKDGDIISYNPKRGTYKTSSEYGDEFMYGVVVLDPVLYLQTNDGSATGTPVVRYGEVTINVSTLGGNIYAGDLVSASPIPGMGQRASKDDGVFVLGFALNDMELTGESHNFSEDTSVELGTVSVALRIGPHVTREGAAFIANSSVNSVTGSAQNEDKGGVDLFKMFRYILASFVAITAVVIAARKFGDTFSQSVISIGRNPLAQSHIRAMVLWNAFLIFLISLVGFGVAAAIILVP